MHSAIGEVPIENDDTNEPVRTDEFVSALVHERAIETPSAPAVVVGRRTLTYGELDSRADQLAAQLRGRGAGSDSVVGLCASRSAEMIVGALAILKAGAAYLPLDSSYPTERLSFILSDAECSQVLLAPGAEKDATKNVQNVLSIDLDASLGTATLLPKVRPAADDLAYVIYTSGSTGQPKGVEITHAGLLNLVHWHQRSFGIRPGDRASQVAAVGFDAAVWEIWPYLTAGACIHIPDESTRSDPEALREWLLSQKINVSFVPTPMAERLLALPWPNKASLRFMLTGGDVLHGYPPPGLPFLLVNNYGPTECAVVATSGALHPYEHADHLPTIGLPIDNVQIHILDEELREVPTGTAGEIHIGGAGLARGYRNRAELTRARFVPNPFEAGTRLYKTGDLGRVLPDGRIAFVGRTDAQIKIRGFRIEPNEIVAALSAHPGVVSSTVVASALGGGEKRLIAYVVFASGTPPAKSALQDALRTRLPEYMVPTAFVRLDALPLGLHGKVDSSALPEPNAANTLRDTELVQPRTPVEEYVTGLVKTLLKIEDVSVDDNFFLLGGHSLLGTQLIARICDAFGIKMSLRDVFQAPTVEQLSAQIEELLVAKLETTENAGGHLVEQPDQALELS